MTDPAPAPEAPDRIGVALAAIGAGASLGGAVVAAGLLIFRSWQASGATLPENVPLLSGPLYVGIVTAVFIAWRVSGPVQDVWQRAIVCGLALFGSAMLAALAAPADILGGRLGILAYGAALAMSGWSALRRARRAGRAA